MFTNLPKVTQEPAVSPGQRSFQEGAGRPAPGGEVLPARVRAHSLCAGPRPRRSPRPVGATAGTAQGTDRVGGC